jgi:hypothetical protein
MPYWRNMSGVDASLSVVLSVSYNLVSAGRHLVRPASAGRFLLEFHAGIVIAAVVVALLIVVLRGAVLFDDPLGGAVTVGVG